jgi:hypothetical protein
MQEEWRQIGDMAYYVSNFGEVYSELTQTILKGSIASGYHKVVLFENGKPEYKAIHRLVAEAFIKKVRNKEYVNHIDGNKLNNCVDNLEWCTPSENVLHSYRTGLQLPIKGVDSFRTDLKEFEIFEIKLALESGNCLQKELAFKYNTSEYVISKINNGVSWSYLTGWTRENRQHIKKGAEGLSAKLSKDDIPQIRKDFLNGMTNAAIAKNYNVHPGTIGCIRTGRNWKNY